MTDKSPDPLEKKEEVSLDPSFYSKEELDYCIELKQLVEPSPSGDLRDGYIGIRTFSLITGRVVMAIVVQELVDSYITVLPLSFGTEEDGSLSIKRVSPTALSRIYKTSIGVTSIPQAIFTLPYLKEVKKNIDELPGFFNPLRISQLDSLIIQLNNGSPEIKEPESENFGDAMGARPGSFTPPEFFEKRLKH